jgi:hypothetical protein
MSNFGGWASAPPVANRATAAARTVLRRIPIVSPPLIFRGS